MLFSFILLTSSLSLSKKKDSNRRKSDKIQKIYKRAKIQMVYFRIERFFKIKRQINQISFLNFFFVSVSKELFSLSFLPLIIFVNCFLKVELKKRKLIFKKKIQNLPKIFFLFLFPFLLLKNIKKNEKQNFDKLTLFYLLFSLHLQWMHFGTTNRMFNKRGKWNNKSDHH